MNTTATFFCAALCCCALLSCGGADNPQDGSQDPAIEDTQADPAVDDAVYDPGVDDAAGDPAADDSYVDPRADDAGEEEPAPAFGIDIIIENGSPETCSSCLFFLAFTFLEFMDYGLGVSYGGEAINWYPPECMLDCEEVTDPEYCCPLCGVPTPTVRQLTPGQRVSLHWNGVRHDIDTSVCDCGCYRDSPVPAGSGIARVCAYESYECLDGTCTPTEEGLIYMAEGAGETVCVEEPFAFPADSGGEVVLTLE